jgi:hypothetical protein
VLDRLQQRGLKVLEGNYMAFIPILVEPMADFPTEVVYTALRTLQTSYPLLFENCMQAIRHIAINSISVEEKSALRLLALFVFSADRPSRMPQLYCHLVGGDEMLEALLQKELRGFNPKLAELIALPCHNAGDLNVPISSFLSQGDVVYNPSSPIPCLALIILMFFGIAYSIWQFFSG